MCVCVKKSEHIEVSQHESIRPDLNAMPIELRIKMIATTSHNGHVALDIGTLILRHFDAAVGEAKSLFNIENKSTH